MHRYAVADLLSDEQKKRAAEATYTLRRVGAPRTGSPLLRCTEGDSYACPLGVALGLQHSPGAIRVAVALGATLPGGYDAIKEFISAADGGLIQPNEVAAALGWEG